MKIFSKGFLLFLLAGSHLGLAKEWLDKSAHIFFPSEVGQNYVRLQNFPSFWWNYFILEKDQQPKRHALCHSLQNHFKNSELSLICGSESQSFKSQLAAWAKDYPLRHPRPNPREWHTSTQQLLAKLSLPFVKQDWLSFWRMDPMQDFKTYLQLQASKQPRGLVLEQGFLTDPQTKRSLIPIQFQFPAYNSFKTEKLKNQFPTPLKSKGVGPHFSALENRNQIIEDVQKLTFSLIFILIWVFGLILIRRSWQVLWLLPPVLLSFIFTSVFFILWFGKLHALNLSVGLSLLGLSFDYGFHILFSSRHRHTWKSNLLGLLTSLCVLIVLAQSQIPLFKQMMLFASIGLSLSFIFIWMLHRLKADQIKLKPFIRKQNFEHPYTRALMGLVLASACILPWFMTPHFSLRSFDYQGPFTIEAQDWLYSKMHLKAPVARMQQYLNLQEQLRLSWEEKRWSQQHQLSYEGLANYYPPEETIQQNLKNWEQSCQRDWSLSKDQQKIFQPFLKNTNCLAIQQLATSWSQTPAVYAQHLWDQQKGWLSLWFPKDAHQRALLKQKYPQAQSISETVENFSRLLYREIQWMIPLSLVLVLGLLWPYFKSLRSACLALLPFFCSVGSVYLGTAIFQWKMSFVSLVSLLILYGMSVDYGIFACDVEEKYKHETWNSLSLSAFSTFIGLIPLLLCRHPVLSDFGKTLLLGVIGCYLGALFGVPLLKKRKVSS